MKHFKFLIQAILGISVLLISCKTETKQITSDMIHFPQEEGSVGDAPVIEFDSLVCHFGTLAIGEKFEHTFRFKNTGNAPLLIAQVTPSCGCTTPKDWPQNPIAPGESGQITVEFDSKGHPGKIDKSITVLTNCLPKVWDLKLIGEVVGKEAKPAEKEGIQMEME